MLLDYTSASGPDLRQAAAGASRQIGDRTGVGQDGFGGRIHRDAGATRYDGVCGPPLGDPVTTTIVKADDVALAAISPPRLQASPTPIDRTS